MTLVEYRMLPQGKENAFYFGFSSVVRCACAHFANHLLTQILASFQEFRNCVHKLSGTDEKAEGKIPTTVFASRWEIDECVLAFVYLEPCMLLPKLLCEGMMGVERKFIKVNYLIK